MNKKGFTLIELIGVITILGIISLIATRTTVSVIKDSKEKVYDKQLTTIKLALQNWKMDNPKLLPEEGESIWFTIGQLKSENYLEDDMKNPKTNTMWPNNMIVSITNNNGYQYTILEDTGTETNKYKKATPFLSFNNGNIVYLNLNESYTDSIVTLNKSDGTKEIIDDITPTIVSGEEEVDTSIPGIYKLKYEMIVDGITIASIQNIVVKSTANTLYRESILNGAYPILKDDLIPVTLDDNGVVTYANTNSKWYSYKNKKWANAVMLVSSPSKLYHVGDTILESDIKAYFVWIPKYSYKLFDLGNYDSNIEEKPDSNMSSEIQIRFGVKNTTDINIGECKTPMNVDNTIGLSGESGNCQIGDFMTHPAFISMNSNGIWVGKFETGGITSNLIIKPNTTSLKNLSVSNMFTASYSYDNSALRVLDSHMMKNTEWGAVAYLSHSKYGINNKININNNSDYQTGYSAVTSTNQSIYRGDSGNTDSITLPYNTVTGYMASTTGNITGIYDMSGGADEAVAAYLNVSSGTNTYIDDLGSVYEVKYYDKYNYNALNVNSYNNRILGDATGELGPFYNYNNGSYNFNHNSWYLNLSNYLDTTNPWFYRGGMYDSGVLAGQFNFYYSTGASDDHISFRIVLAPR